MTGDSTIDGAIDGATSDAGRAGAPRSGRRRLVVVLVAIGLVLAVLALVPGAAPPGRDGGADSAEPAAGPVDPEAAGQLVDQLVAAVTPDGVLAQVADLQADADRNGGHRAADTAGYDASLDRLAGLLREAGFQVSVLDRPALGPTRARSLIAQTTTGRTDEVVMAGAHLDSVPAGPGANDNGSGSAALLELALRMGGAPPVRNAVRFAWWGAEEIGLHGSRQYVADLGERQRADIAVYLNADMIGSPNAGYFVYRPDGTATSELVHELLTGYLAERGIEAEQIDMSGRSDHEPFGAAGVPTGGLFTGAEAEMTQRQAELWGGRAGEPFDPCYHAGCDRTGALNRRAVDVCADALTWLVSSAAVRADLLPNRAERTG